MRVPATKSVAFDRTTIALRDPSRITHADALSSTFPLFTDCNGHDEL
jgi:hypothetical protein